MLGSLLALNLFNLLPDVAIIDSLELIVLNSELRLKYLFRMRLHIGVENRISKK
jgi:hypothetical protein